MSPFIWMRHKYKYNSDCIIQTFFQIFFLIAKMSAYAASIAEKKSHPKHRKSSKHQNLSKLKPTGIDTSYSVSGLFIRQKLVKSGIRIFEIYLSLVYGVLLIAYIFWRKCFFTTSYKDINPYSMSSGQQTSSGKSGSYKDLSRTATTSTESSGGPKIKPPACLEDPVLGSHKFIKIQVGH